MPRVPRLTQPKEQFFRRHRSIFYFFSFLFSKAIQLLFVTVQLIWVGSHRSRRSVERGRSALFKKNFRSGTWAFRRRRTINKIKICIEINSAVLKYLMRLRNSYSSQKCANLGKDQTLNIKQGLSVCHYLSVAWQKNWLQTIVTD